LMAWATVQPSRARVTLRSRLGATSRTLRPPGIHRSSQKYAVFPLPSSTSVAALKTAETVEFCGAGSGT
jgi:hypothetical protein